ncbi:MAG: enoyl-CoA hydratase/isomerase family protein [Chloroflexi bacterium]|nr:enoyl-CoA hydratase/isomerase family protein [Chloroflexota bacterium]
MHYEDLLLEKKDGVATIILNVPDKRNAITTQMRKSLISAVSEIAQDDAVRAVIITGASSAFCAGGDIQALKARIDGTMTAESRYERLRRVGNWIEIFPRLDKPVIAAINGPALGAGFSLAMSCDIRIASVKAKFGSAFILLGLVPDCALTYFLPRATGISKALELMFTGVTIDAEEAKSLGIVSRVVPHDDLMKTAHELAARIVEQAPIAIELTKRLVYRSVIDDAARHIDWETYAQQLCWRTEDFKESARAFLEKRPRPSFRGR